MIPRRPHCRAEAFPWVRGYGNFLQGKNEEEYEKNSQYILPHKDKKTLFIELGVGRMAPMFIRQTVLGIAQRFSECLLYFCKFRICVSAETN